MFEIGDEIGKEHIAVLVAMSEQPADSYYKEGLRCVTYKNAGGYDVPLVHQSLGRDGNEADNPYPRNHPLHDFRHEAWIGAPADVVSKLEALGFVVQIYPTEPQHGGLGEKWVMEVKPLMITERGRDFLSRCILKWLLSRFTARANKWVVSTATIMVMATGFVGTVLTLWRIGVWVAGLFVLPS